MRRSSATQLIAPAEAAVVLSALRCASCGTPDITAWVTQRTPNGANETCLCLGCWSEQVVPAMRHEKEMLMAGRLRKANGKSVPLPDYLEDDELADGGAGDAAYEQIGKEIAMLSAETFAADTLTGDLRDFILDRLRHEQDKKPWHERSEAAQKDTIHQVEAAVKRAVTKAVELIAGHGRSAIKASLTQIVVKDGIKGIIELSKHDPLRHALMDAQGATVLIVLADPETFDGERAPVPVLADQPELVGVVHSNPLS